MRRHVSVWLTIVLAWSQARAQTTVATTRATTKPAAIAFRACRLLVAQTRDQNGRAFEIHGLSGVTYAGGNTYWAVLDNSDKIVRLEVKLNGDGSIESADVTTGLTLADRADYEGIAYFAPHDSVFVSEETTPAVHEYSLSNGRRLGTLETPQVFLHGHTVINRGFESLALTRDSLWTANEHALTVDGSPQTPAEPFGSTTRVRVLRYALDAHGHATPAEQFVYQTSGVHELAGFNRLTGLAALPDGRLLGLERSAGQNIDRLASIRTRIFLIDFAHATHAIKPPWDHGLANRSPVTVHKTLLFDALLCDADGENLEGLCLGPRLGENRWAVIGVVDDTDGGLGVSKTQVVAFVLTLPR